MSPAAADDTHPAGGLLDRLSRLSAAEEFLAYFGIRYDEDVVHVHRLHILKRFYQYLHHGQPAQALDEAALHGQYAALLQRAYDDFVTSTAAREKVFKVFQDAQARSFPIDKLRCTLPSGN
jgi:nitrogenase-stabilizing/protective protein